MQMQIALNFVTNNGVKIEVTQSRVDGTVNAHPWHDVHDFYSLNNDLKIPPEDFVNLLSLYQYIKENDIQNYFINPAGKVSEFELEPEDEEKE